MFLARTYDYCGNVSKYLDLRERENNWRVERIA
jgi:hypothetical protein